MLNLKACRRPSCLKKFQGEAGLNIHLGLVQKCSSWYKRMFSNRLDIRFETSSENASDSGSAVDSDYEDVPLPWTRRKLKRKRRNEPRPPDTLLVPLNVAVPSNINDLDAGQSLPWTTAKVREACDALRRSGVYECAPPSAQSRPNHFPASTADSQPLFDNESLKATSEFESQSILSIDSDGFWTSRTTVRWTWKRTPDQHVQL